MEAQDTHGYTVLYLAVANLHIEIAELLVRDVTDARYYISRLSMSGTGALDVAAASGDTDMIRLLVNSGADVPSAKRQMPGQSEPIWSGSGCHLVTCRDLAAIWLPSGDLCTSEVELGTSRIDLRT
jgi:ankyrin repeat protein